MRRSSLAAVLESTFVATGLALAVSYRFFEPIWDVGASLLALGALTALAYFAGIVLLLRRKSKRSGLLQVVLVTLVVSQPVLLTMGLLGWPLSRIALIFELVLLFLGLALAATRLPASLRVGAAVAFAGAAAYPTVIGGLAVGETRSLPATEGRYMFSGYHDVNVTEYTILEDEQQRGGAMTLLPDGRVLLVAGSGAARMLTIRDGLEASEVDLRLPIDVDEYRAQASNPTPYYRVTDILYSDEHLLASYTGWDPDADCYTLRLAEAEFDGSTTGPWTTRFESQPCVELSSLNNQAGGALAALDSLHVLLTIGAFGKEWSEDADYGTIVKLNTETWQPEVFSRGHRNPQGLVVSEAGIWSTEHGPDGGDELNAIEAGRHYGWPLVSYGTDYGKKTLASGSTPGDHSGFEEPVHAWLPSVGISSLIRVTGDGFPLWKGDLLIGSLSGLGNGRALFRVRLVEGNVVSVEQIRTGMLIRDLLELPDGSLIIWSGGESVQVVRPADHVFSQCSACHGVHREAHGIGPDLRDVVGRPVARHSDYEYSDAMKAYGGRWTKARLDRFLESPSDEIPGTKMEYDGIEDPAERAAIITFLEDTRDPGP